MDWGRVLFDLDGRIDQQTYWIGVAILVVANFVLPAIPIIGPFAWFILIWCGFAIYGKRLRDGGRSAWLHLVPWAVNIAALVLGFVLFGASLIPVFADLIADTDPSGASVSAAIAGTGLFLLVMLAITLMWVGYTIWVGLLPSRGTAADPLDAL